MKLTLALGLCFVSSCSSAVWSGATIKLENGTPEAHIVGEYKSLEACQANMQKTGGMCGTGCKHDEAGRITSCKDALIVDDQ